MVTFPPYSVLTSLMDYPLQRALWHYRSPIGLVGNHIDVMNGKWTSTEAGIGAGVDSYYE